MIELEVKKGKSGHCYAAKIVRIHSLETFAGMSFTELAVLNTEKMVVESLDCSRENFDVLKCGVCITRHTAVTTLCAANLNSTSKN